MKFKAENGEVVEARDEVQAAAFKNAGLEVVEEVEEPKKGKKNQE